MTVDEKNALIQLYNHTPAFDNLFEASIYYGDSAEDAMTAYSKLHVVSLDFKGPQLVLKRHETAKLFTLQNYQLGDSVTITWREDAQFSVRKFHQEWLHKFYNEDRDCFISYDNVNEANKNLSRVIKIKLQNGHQVTLSGVYPQKIPDLKVDWNSKSNVQYTLTYYVTSWEWI